MSSNHPNFGPAIDSTLPQCGFGADVDFESLIKSNRFLFRVYTPKERSPFADDTDPFFIAPRFDELVNRSPVDLPNVKFSETVVGSYAEAARHMEWTTRSSSSYISTSFSFSWAIWEAVKRYHLGVKKDVEIAIIDATLLGGRAATAVQLLNKSSPTERNEQFWKWHRFSEDSQSVLVYGMVPRTAVLASIPLLQILRKMPSYFLHKDVQIISGNPLGQVAWDYTKRKLSYRQFCHDMGQVFISRPVEVRLRDSTAGAVRLALSFLRPFFHHFVVEDFDVAISYLRTLAIIISEWPGGLWVHEHPEIRQIVEAMVLALGEELREKYSHQKAEEISRLQLVIVGLEQNIQSQQHKEGARYIMDDIEVDSDGDFEVELFEESDEPTLVTQIGIPPVIQQQERHRPSLAMSVTVLPRIPIAFHTPITPPESPRSSLFIPTVTATLVDTAFTQFSFKSESAVEKTTQDRQTSALKTSPFSEEPTSPPPTPPTRSPIFSPQKLPDTDEMLIEHPEVVNCVADDVDEKGIETAVEEESSSVNAKPENEVCLEGEIRPVYYSHEYEEDDGEETEHEEDATHAGDMDHEERDHDGYQPPFPISHSWVAVRRSQHSMASPLSSPRSSIMSIETLCEPNDFPLKRLSLATAYSDSIDFVPSMRSLGLMSRTVSFSFSDFSPPTRPLALVEDVDPLSIPLPVSPAFSQESLPSSVSRSSSGTSSTSRTSEATDRLLPLVIPLPPSPSLSMGSLPSTLSRTSSSSSSSIHVESPLERTLPTGPEQLIIPPKRGISLLSPLSPQMQDDDDDADTSSIRSANVGETASYIVTGFLVGAFLTLFLFSTQRRTILYLT